jgi:hypothetical protein
LLSPARAGTTGSILAMRRSARAVEDVLEAP